MHPAPGPAATAAAPAPTPPPRGPRLSRPAPLCFSGLRPAGFVSSASEPRPRPPEVPAALCAPGRPPPSAGRRFHLFVSPARCARRPARRPLGRASARRRRCPGATRLIPPSSARPRLRAARSAARGRPPPPPSSGRPRGRRRRAAPPGPRAAPRGPSSASRPRPRRPPRGARAESPPGWPRSPRPRAVGGSGAEPHPEAPGSAGWRSRRRPEVRAAASRKEQQVQGRRRGRGCRAGTGSRALHLGPRCCPVPAPAGRGHGRARAAPGGVTVGCVLVPLPRRRACDGARGGALGSRPARPGGEGAAERRPDR